MKHFADLSPSALRVVDAAEGLIQQHGYNGFSYDDISRLIDIKKPGIHHHFARKDALVATVVQRYTYRFQEKLRAIENEVDSAKDRLMAYQLLFEQTFLHDRRLCLCGMLGAEADSLPKIVTSEVSRFFDANIEWLTRVINEGQQAKQVQSHTDAESIAKAFLCTLEGVMVVGRALRTLNGPVQIGNIFLSTVLT